MVLSCSFPGALPLPAAAADDGGTPHPVLRGFQATGKYVFQPKGGVKTETPPKPKAEDPPKPKPEPPPKPEPKPETPPKAAPAAEPTGEPKAEPPSAPKSEPPPEGGTDARPVVPMPKTAPNGGPWVGPPPEPAPKPGEEAPGKPTDEPSGKPAEKPTEKPAEKPTEKPAEKPAEAPSVKAAPGVYYSRRASAYLVVGSPLGRPFLVRTGMNAVESVPEDSVLARGEGILDLRSDTTPTSLGSFRLEDADIVIDVPGVAGRLTPPPLLLGWHTAEDLLTHTPEYGRDAKACPMDAVCVSSLRSCTTDVRVVVYFGSWCSSCSLLLGRILRLEQEINKDVKEGGKPVIRFAYYGLPAPPATWTEPEAVLRDLDHLPTAIIFVNGAYCNRIGAADLGRPDVALRAVLIGR